MKTGAEIVLEWFREYSEQNGTPTPSEIIHQLLVAVDHDNIELKPFYKAKIMPSLESLDFVEMRRSKWLSLRKVENITGMYSAYISQIETGKIKRPAYQAVKALYDLYNKEVPKLNPEDNTITIYEVKDNWSKEEVKLLFNSLYNRLEGNLDTGAKIKWEYWIKENL